MSPRPVYVPDFFVVGAAKAGTTAVFNWLKDHKEVFLPTIKEPGYFAFAGRRAAPLNGPYDPDYYAQVAVDPSVYSQLYTAAQDRLSGDVSPIYLIDQTVAARIAVARPDARIIMILRDPVERAFSQFLHHIRDGLEPAESFEAALEQEAERHRNGWSWGHGYASNGHYAAQIDRYLEVFPREHLLFLEYSQLNSAPDACWEQVCAHLGILHTPLARNDRVNVSSALANVTARPTVTRALRHPGVVQRVLKPLLPRGIRGHIRRIIEGRGKPLPVLQDSTRRTLAARFDNERSHIAQQTGLCLDHWTRPS